MAGIQVLDGAGDVTVTSSFVGYNFCDGDMTYSAGRVQPDVTEAGPQSRVRRGLQHFGVVVRLGEQLLHRRKRQYQRKHLQSEPVECFRDPVLSGLPPHPQSGRFGIGIAAQRRPGGQQPIRIRIIMKII